VSEATESEEPRASGPGQESAPAGDGGGSRPERSERPRRSGGGGGGGGRGRFGRRRVCSFCVDKVKAIDYKEPGRFRRYISERGKIEPRRKTGTCAHHQRMLTLALKRARHVALLPYTAEHVRISGMFQTRG
jgi:small subunit ribosomal protein S18